MKQMVRIGQTAIGVVGMLGILACMGPWCWPSSGSLVWEPPP
jgi:hypothetical protein